MCTWAQGDIYTVAGNGGSGHSGDGRRATSARLRFPGSVSVDRTGNLIIADSFNERVRVVAVSATNPGYLLADCSSICRWAQGDIYTVAGDGVGGYSGDGGPAASAEMSVPEGVTVDRDGDLLVADHYSSRVRVVAVASRNPGYELAGCLAGCTWTPGDIYSVAGNGQRGYAGDGGPATSARLALPSSATVDSSGNIVVADSGNHVLRLVALSPGNPGYQLGGCPAGCTWTSGSIYTVAGNGLTGYSGDGGSATSASLSNPVSAAVDGFGNIVMADLGNDVVWVVAISPDDPGYALAGGDIWTVGDIYTIAGDGTQGYSGDGGDPTAAELNQPSGVAVDSIGDVVIADSGNHAIRLVAVIGANPLMITRRAG
jgi:trimeric autotransporter adhesin